MKNISKIILIFLVLFLASCKDYYIKTTIHPDGSLKRTIIIKSDNSQINFADLSFRIDSTWQTEKKKDTLSSSYTFTAVKEFESADKLNEYMKNNQEMMVDVSLEKKFRWFYTYYNYRETFKKTNPYDRIDIKNFLTADEYNKLEKAEFDDSLSTRLEEYLKENLFAEFFDKLIVAITTNKDFDKNLLITNETEIKKCIENDFLIDCIIGKIEKIYLAKITPKMRTDIENIVTGIEEKFMNSAAVNESFEYEITMPGLLLSTNADGINGSTGHWKFDAKAYTYIDYSLKAESRVANIWALIITAVFGLLLIIVIIIPRRKKAITYS